MSYVNPIWLEGQRKRWRRHDAHLWVHHDAHRFAPPGSAEANPGAASVAERKSETDNANSAAELAAFYAGHLEVRRQLADLKFELAFRRIFRKYSPDQPRDDRGRWTNENGVGGRNDPRIISDATPDNEAIPGAHYAQGRTRGPVAVRIGGRTIEVEGGQAARLAEAQTRAEDAIARVRELDPNWRPTPSTYESVEGLVRTHEAEAREAQARASELTKVGIGPGPFAGDSIPARGPERNFTTAERSEINRIGAETGCHTCSTTEPRRLWAISSLIINRRLH